MKKFALTVLFILLASPAWATTYFLAPASAGGNDSNNGTSASTPWLSPNHPVNCGDTITATPSTAYSASNFGAGKWGAVSCPSANNVAWLTCARFDACKITASGNYGMWVSSNFWGVQGWEITTSGSFASCFLADPGSASGSTIHHIIFANNVANVCTDGGFQIVNSGSNSVDYIAIIGNAAYNTTSDSSECYSGISILTPKNSDTAAGTHIFVAGNFSWNNFDPSPCAGGTPTDGEGIILDTLTHYSYTGQIVVNNNMFLGNGARGWQVVLNNGSSFAPIYAEYNTVYGNGGDSHENSICGEMLMNESFGTTFEHNLAMTNRTVGCGSNPVYAFYVSAGNSTDVVDFNWGYSASGTNEIALGSSGFSYGSNNVFGTNPNFSNASIPGAPSCGSATSVPNCMATVVANFTPTNAAAKAYGYQIPSTSSTSDPLFPKWLCNVTLPPGLVTMGCGSGPASSLPAPPTNISATVK
jgi:hypothetical protein